MAKVIYLDTSAAVKLISDEQESDGLRSYLDEGPILVSSDLDLRHQACRGCPCARTGGRRT